jgi:Raf kinase inhibitor-like YbhB/YbcL family protein
MSGAPQGGSGGAGGGGGAFMLTSPDHTEGEAFEDKYTCALAGFNGSLLPELNWTAGPAGTQSYAITFIDTTLSGMTPPDPLGYHWVIWNIPATTLSLPEEFTDAASIGAMQTGNYLGPCPNFGSGSRTDTYEFTIYALDTASITVPAGGQSTARVMAAEEMLEGDHLAKATLSGTSDASPP